MDRSNTLLLTGEAYRGVGRQQPATYCLQRLLLILAVQG